MDMLNLKASTKPLKYRKKCFEHDIASNIVVYNTLIDGLCKSNRIPMACQLFKGMQTDGIKPDVCTYASLLDGLCKNVQLDEAVELLTEMESNEVAPNLFIYNILIDSLYEASQISDAGNLVSDLLSRVLVPNIVNFNTVIKGFCKKGLMGRALELLNKMKLAGVSPDSGYADQRVDYQ